MKRPHQSASGLPQRPHHRCARKRVREIEIDPERADLVRFAFTAYATGDWPLSRLVKELTARSLTTRPTPSQPAKPVTTTGLHKILTNPYYQGTVTFRSVTYEGTHEPLVDAETWLRVQTNLDANNACGERPQMYDHYLKGTLYCACEAKLMIERPRDKLEAERLKLVQARYADTIPHDLLKREQDRIRASLDQITTQLDNLTNTYADARTGLDQLTELLVDLDDLYNKCEPAERRILNRALFTRIPSTTTNMPPTHPSRPPPASSPTPASMPRPTSPQKQNCPAIRRGKFRSSHLTWR